MKRILPIVEGDGDFEAVPELIRRIAAEAGHYDVKVLRPHKRGDLPKVMRRFDDYLKVALLEDSPILWVLDYDCKDCLDAEADLVRLRKLVAAAHSGHEVEFVFMIQEFETLFLADHETTKAVFPDIDQKLPFPAAPESIRDAKGWISKARPKGSAYKPTQHQQRLTSQVNLGRLRERSASFAAFEIAVTHLIECQS